MTRPRDSQRSRLYDAEAYTGPDSKAAVKHLHGGPTVASTGNLSIAACQAYVDHVTSAAWFQRRWGRRQITVRHKTYGSATGGNGRITLPPWSRNEGVILHELAHNLVPNAYAAHGPEFAGVLLTLVRHVKGVEAARMLRESFRKRRVRYSLKAVPKPTRPIVPRTAQVAEVAARRREAAKSQEAERLRVMREKAGRVARSHAAETIRLAAKAGHFGPAGSKPRAHALATARALDKPRRETRDFYAPKGQP